MRAGGERHRSAPWEVDPAVRAPPDVVGTDDRVRLLVEHGGSDLGRVRRAELADEREGSSGVRDVGYVNTCSCFAYLGKRSFPF